MSLDLKAFKNAYEKWVIDGQADYESGKMLEVVKRYPLIVSEDVPWTPYTGTPNRQTVVLITSGGLDLKNSQPVFNTVSIHGDPPFREISIARLQREDGEAAIWVLVGSRFKVEIAHGFDGLLLGQVLLTLDKLL